MPLRPVNRDQAWLLPQPLMISFQRITRPALLPPSWMDWTAVRVCGLEGSSESDEETWRA